MRTECVYTFYLFIPIVSHIYQNIRLNIIILYKVQYQIWPPFLLFLAVIFIGMASTVLPVIMGNVPAGIEATSYRDTPGTVLPLLALMGIILMLGLWIPLPMLELLHDAARLLGGNR